MSQPIITAVSTPSVDFSTTATILKTSILSTAASVMMIHNHPSGDIEPSAEDIKITNNLYSIYKLMKLGKRRINQCFPKNRVCCIKKEMIIEHSRRGETVERSRILIACQWDILGDCGGNSRRLFDSFRRILLDKEEKLSETQTKAVLCW